MAYLSSGDLGAPFNPVLIEDDDDDDHGYIARRAQQIEKEAQTGRRLAALVASRSAPRAGNDRYGSPSQSDDLDDRELQIEKALEELEGIADAIDLTGDDDLPSIQARVPTVPRDLVREVVSYDLPNGDRLQAGTTVELKQRIGAFGIEFLKLTSIVKSGSGQDVTIRGLGFARTRHLEGMLLSQLNEVAMVAEVSNSSGRQWVQEAMIDVKPSDIEGVRELRITNTLFPEHRFSDSDYRREGKRWVEKESPLVCRFRFHVHYHSNSEKPCEWAFFRISESEADPEYRTMDEKNLNRWRGGKVPGGSHNPGGLGHPVCDLETEPSSRVRALRPSPEQRYTAGDVFSGAGGASRGIERAGLKLMFAVDHWAPAVASLRSNFGDSHIHDMDVFDFITSKDTGCKVDILHLSPPCQFWSPAHTVAGQNDEANIAVLFSCTDLIEKHRPRLFTVEQTFGILNPRFKEFFNLFLQGFTKFGYSVRWKVLPLANYGVPQTRRRLIMIGSAPGEKLPRFPPPTHNKDGTGGLKPWATPKSVLATLPRGLVHKLHQPHNIKRYNPPRRQWDADKLARTITTNGGQNYHWNGRRDFTLLEYAVLQGFPTWHKFEGSYIKKQIGNAFAPSVVKVLYDHLVDWLLEQDGFDPATARRNNSRAGLPADLSPDAYIHLDDDDDSNGDPSSSRRNSSRSGRASNAYILLDDDDDSEGDVSPIRRTNSRAGLPADLSPDAYICLDDDDDGSDSGPSPVRQTNSRAALSPNPARNAYILSDDSDVNTTINRRPSSATHHPNPSAKQPPNHDTDTDMMDLDGLDELSDTETLRDDEEGPESVDGGDSEHHPLNHHHQQHHHPQQYHQHQQHGRWDVRIDVMEVDMVGYAGVIDLTRDRGRGRRRIRGCFRIEGGEDCR